MNVTTNQTYTGFGWDYSGSSKIPDLAVEFKNAAGELETKFVLEVGFSEKYEDLVQDVKMWLEGKREVSVVLLVKFEETPRYQYPVHEDDDLGQLGFLEITEIRARDFSLEGEYGPVTYMDFTWVGRYQEPL